MGNVYQGFISLSEGLTPQVCYTIFCHHVMYMSSGSDNTSTSLQEWYNSWLSFACCGRQCKDWLSTLGQGSTSQKVHLTTDTRIDGGSNRISAHLTGQVNFNAAINGSDFRVLLDDGWVINFLDGQHLDFGVVVNKVVEFFGAHQEAGYNDILVDGFFGVVDDTLLHQVDDTFGKHLCVNSQILVVGQSSQDSVRDCSNTHLKGSTVLYKVGNLLSDLPLNLSQRFWFLLWQRIIYFHNVV
mmetsp:Transcript_10587/g.14499  ORF Transcript_10587/g.14499 Transcript_10587/m.14499 type:complete len:241 (+) Transcript_10587:143-865(+)